MIVSSEIPLFLEINNIRKGKENCSRFLDDSTVVCTFVQDSVLNGSALCCPNANCTEHVIPKRDNHSDSLVV